MAPWDNGPMRQILRAAVRTMSPLLLLLALLALRGRSWVFAAPPPLLLRIALQHQAQLKAAPQGLH